MHCFGIAILSVTFAFGPAFATEMSVQRNLPYAKTTNERQTLDIYKPADAKAAPIFIWIHGGAWRFGNKTGVQEKPQAFVDKGFIFVSVNYRFVPKVKLDEMTADIAKAVKWIHDRADKNGGDSKKIFIGGHSAGAHLAALVCTDETYLKAEGLSLADIKGCIPVDTAVYDAAKQIKDRGRFGSRLYVAAFGEDVKSQQKYSPLTHVTKDKDLPPFLLLHVASRADSTAQSKAFAKAITDAGGTAELVPGEDKTHASINRELGNADDPPTVAVFEFLSKQLNQTKK
jgi:arylformamidase